jgi:16S rRNA (guanine527-N7)-methyltransferase
MEGTMSGDHEAILSEALSCLGICVPGNVAAGLVRYWGLVMEANGGLNLVSRRCGRSEGLILHVADSLAALKLGFPEEGLDVLDLGSGGGFPGIPLKLARPGWRLCLAEATLKKARFLERAAEDLGIGGLEVLARYVPHGGMFHGARPGRFDLAVTRAVSTALDVARRVAPLLKAGGGLVAYKGPSWKEEIKSTWNDIGREGLSLEKVLEFSLPCTGAPARALLLFRYGG